MLVRNLTIAAGVAAGIAGTMLARRRTPITFKNHVAFISGGRAQPIPKSIRALMKADLIS